MGSPDAYLVHAGRRVDCPGFPTPPSVCRKREPRTTSPCYQPGAGRYVGHWSGASGAGGLYAARGLLQALRQGDSVMMWRDNKVGNKLIKLVTSGFAINLKSLSHKVYQ
jgi:hypothetical protein